MKTTLRVLFAVIISLFVISTALAVSGNETNTPGEKRKNPTAVQHANLNAASSAQVALQPIERTNAEGQTETAGMPMPSQTSPSNEADRSVSEKTTEKNGSRSMRKGRRGVDFFSRMSDWFSNKSRSVRAGKTKSKGSDSLALASMILGIVGFVFTFVPVIFLGILAFLMGLGAIIMGHISLKKGQRRAFGITGLVFGYLTIFLFLLVWLLLFVVILAVV